MEKIKLRLSRSRLLKWVIHRKELWQWTRHSVALGAAIGVGFGLLIPLAQIPASALMSVVFRANIGAASIATLVSNPITFAPLYYAAYKFGERVTGIEFIPLSASDGVFSWLSGVGLPLMIGLGMFALVGFGLTYATVYCLFGVNFKRFRW